MMGLLSDSLDNKESLAIIKKMKGDPGYLMMKEYVASYVA